MWDYLSSNLVNQEFLTAQLFLSTSSFSGISFQGIHDVNIEAGVNIDR